MEGLQKVHKCPICESKLKKPKGYTAAIWFVVCRCKSRWMVEGSHIIRVK